MGLQKKQLPWAEHDALGRGLLGEDGTVGKVRMPRPQVHAGPRLMKQLKPKAGQVLFSLAMSRSQLLAK
jgi:hypothetical protein